MSRLVLNRPQRATASRRLVLLALAVGLPLSACGVPPARARTGPESFAPIVKRVLPAVVNIAIVESVPAAAGGVDDPMSEIPLPPELQRQFRNQLRGRRQQMQGAGSGFIIDPSGYIVTNNHVVGNADRITVALTNGREYPATLVGTDPLTDVALIRVSAPGPLPYVSFGSSQSVEVGDWVVAAGNPFGLGGSITAGIVSARGRDIGEGPLDDFIQIDAPINPGNSGGPVFDEDGQVVGMNTAIVSPTGGSVGIGFAIPAETVSRVVAVLRRGGHVERGWLGVSIKDAPRDPGDDSAGVDIDSVDAAGPAARAGIRAGDIVTAIDGTAVGSANSLIRAITAVPPGNSVRLTLRRGGRALDVSVAVGRRPDGQG